MRCLVLPDMHLHLELLDRAEFLLKKHKVDQIVALGDYVDDWNAICSQYEGFAKRFKEFTERHPDILYCWGNHDYCYFHEPPSQSSGYNPDATSIVREMLGPLVQENRMKIAHKIDCTIFSHAGIDARWREVTRPIRSTHKSLIDQINSATTEQLWIKQSPLWLRPTPHLKSFNPTLLQVVGHTPYPCVFQNRGFLFTDTWSNFRHHEPIGDHSLAIVDTVTGAWNAY